MRKVIDPREAKYYDNTTVVSAGASAAPALALKRDPNRISLILTYTGAEDPLTIGAVQAGVMRGAVFVPLAVVNVYAPMFVLTLDQFGQAIQEDIFVQGVNRDTPCQLTDMHLSFRGS